MFCQCCIVSALTQHSPSAIKKAVDILVMNEDKTITTVEVKGLAKAYDWPADNIHQFKDARHFYALVSFEGKINDPLSPPVCMDNPIQKVKSLC